MKKNKAAVELGRLGGLKKSERKTLAVRANARKPRKQKKRMNTFKHQGDITFIPLNKFEHTNTEAHDGSYIVGYGEATGHHHMVTVANPHDLEIVKVSDGYIMRLTSEATVTHQEHKPIILAPGIYRVGHEREKDWFSLATRNVID